MIHIKNRNNNFMNIKASDDYSSDSSNKKKIYIDNLLDDDRLNR